MRLYVGIVSLKINSILYIKLLLRLFAELQSSHSHHMHLSLYHSRAIFFLIQTMSFLLHIILSSASSQKCNFLIKKASSR